MVDIVFFMDLRDENREARLECQSLISLVTPIPYTSPSLSITAIFESALWQVPIHQYFSD